MGKLTLLFLSTIIAGSAGAAAYVPANRPYDALHYRIQLTLDPAKDADTFVAQSEVRFKAKQVLESATFDVKELKIEKVALVKPTKRDLAFKANDKAVEVTFPGKMRKGDTWTLQFTYQGKINTGHRGLFKVVDPDEPKRGPIYSTQFETSEARSFFPCNDEPYDKATTEIETTVPETHEALSNGARVADKKVKRNGATWRQITWRISNPHPTYLVSLAVGPFTKVADTYRGREISIWVGATKAEKARFALAKLKDAMQFMEAELGVPYPWQKYSVVGVPTFVWGGMENTSSTHQNQERTVLNEASSEFEKVHITALAAHELAHQWFGDYVTMQWWNDVWLNESFATYLGSEATKAAFKNEEQDIYSITELWDSYFRQEDGPRSHPIVQAEITSAEDGFDSINYEKGAAVLKMLRYYVGGGKADGKGDKVFRDGVRRYLTAAAYGNATNEDFFAAMSKAAGEDLSKFRNSWLLQRGYPVVSHKGTWDAKTSTYALTLTQRPNHAEDKSKFHFRMPIAFHRKAAPAYAKTFSILFDGNGAAERTDKYVLPAEPEWVSLNTGGVALVRVEPAVRDEALLAAQAAGDSDVIARVWAVMELLRPLKDGGELSDAAEKAVAQFLRQDPSPYARIAVVEAFGKMKAARLPTTLATTVLELARGATANSYEVQPLFLSDRHGWREWRSHLYGAVGRVKPRDAMEFLAPLLGRRDLPLDDLERASYALAVTGQEKSGAMLREALKLHRDRGYRYQYVVQRSFGAYENPAAAADIAEMAKTSGADLFGKIGGVVRDNQTLKASPEWARVLKEIVLANRFDDEVKARLLQTVEETRTDAVKTTLEAVANESGSARLKEVAKKILEKNFSVTKPT